MVVPPFSELTMTSNQDDMKLLRALKKLYFKIMTLYMNFRSGAFRGQESGGGPNIVLSLSKCIDKIASEAVVNRPGTAAPHLVAAGNVPGGDIVLDHASSLSVPSSGMGVGELSVHFRNSHIHSALFCDVGERLISSTWEHIDASLRTAREGDVKMAKLHIDLANNAFKEAARYLPAPLYASFSQDVKKALEQINS